jgi:FkbM family methyltransferase
MKTVRAVSPLTYWYRKLLKPRQVRIDGFRVSGFDAPMDEAAWKGLWRGVHERTERSIIRGGFLRPGDRVLEGGGGIGLVTLNIARIVGAGNVLTFEAIPQAADAIIRNGKANGLDLRVTAKALSDHAGTMTMTIGTAFLGASLHDRGFTKSLDVEVADIAEAIREFRPNVLVLDIEGAEVEVLARAPLQGIDRIMMETHPKIVGADRIDAMTDALVKQGFAPSSVFGRNDTVVFERRA